MNEPTIAQRIDHRSKDEIHECVVPSCEKRAQVALYVEAPTRLAGRDWQPGDFVDLCPGDHMVLLDAVSEAQALRPDKFVHLLDALDELDGNEPANPLDRLREWSDGQP